MTSMETIRAMVDLIAADFHPERIVLFGGYARGKASEDSDVDLLVEFVEDPRPGGRGNPLHRVLAERFGVPTDVVIHTSAAVRKYRDNPYSLIYRAFAEGRVLYDKHAR